MTQKIQTSSGNVFQDLGFAPEESTKLQLKAKLMHAIETYIDTNQLTQADAAAIMGVSRPRISDVVRGKIEKFTIDALIDMLSKANIKVEIHTSAA